MQRQAGVVINYLRYTKNDDVMKVVAALQQLPLPEFESAIIPDPDATVMVLQREQAYVDSAKRPVRFIGTKRLSDCLLVMFTIIDVANQKSYFTVHIDGNDTYQWEGFFKTLKNCAISAMIVGGFVGSPQGAKNVQALMSYLLKLTDKLNIEITMTSQCVQQSFTPVLEDWPCDFSFRIRNKASVLYRRLFGKELPAELAQCAFDRSMQQATLENKNISIQVAGTGFTWAEFVDFIIDSDAILKNMVDTLLINARALVPTPEAFARYYKQLFTAAGFRGAEITFAAINSLPKVKANNFVINLQTNKITIVPSNYPDGKYALPRRLRVADMYSNTYSDCYTAKDGYIFPVIHERTLAYFKQAAETCMRDLPNGLSYEVVDDFMKRLMAGYGIKQIGINVTLETCWLAYQWSQANKEDLVAPLTSTGSKLLVRIQYLNKITGVKFAAKGDHDAVYASEQQSDLLVIQKKLAAINIPATLIENGLLVESLVKYTEILRTSVTSKSVKQNEGFKFSFK